MSESMPYAPDPLNASEYNHLRIRMLGKAGLEPALVRANILFETPVYHIRDPDHWDEDYSFAGQMKALYGSSQAPAPDIFVLTEYSAIPVADAIRGYHDAAMIERPRITSCPHQLTGIGSITRDPEAIANFNNRLFGSQHAVVVDQFVHTGHTLMRACRAAIGAGVPFVTAIRGSWYQQVKEKPTAEEYYLLTSPHAKIMYKLGQQAVLNI